MSDSGEGIQHISEQINLCKKQLNSYSKFYSRLPQFIFKNKSIQNDMIYDIYVHNSKLEGLLREIIELELNEETFRQVSHLQQQQQHSYQQQQPNCFCPHCNNDNGHYHKDDYYEEDDEDE